MRHYSLAIITVFTLSMSLAGCGYHHPGQGTCRVSGGRDLTVAIFTNTTTEPFLENFVTNAVTEELASADGLQLSAEAAEFQLAGEIVNYRVVALSYDRDDEITEYRLTLGVKSRLIRVKDGKFLWKGQLERSSEFLADADRTRQRDNERRAAQDAAYQLAEDLRAEICLMTGEQ